MSRSCGSLRSTASMRSAMGSPPRRAATASDRQYAPGWAAKHQSQRQGRGGPPDNSAGIAPHESFSAPASTAVTRPASQARSRTASRGGGGGACNSSWRSYTPGDYQSMGERSANGTYSRTSTPQHGMMRAARAMSGASLGATPTRVPSPIPPAKELTAPSIPDFHGSRPGTAPVLILTQSGVRPPDAMLLVGSASATTLRPQPQRPQR